MEKTKKKRIRSLKVIATNLFMALSVIAIAGILTLLAMGYSLTKDGSLEQSGMLQLHSQPEGATVEINGELDNYRTEMSKMLSEGTHKVNITKPGYDNWSTEVAIESGLLTRIDWIRLFPLDRIIERVHSYKTIRQISVSPNKYHLAILPEDSARIEIIDIHTDEIKYSHIDLSENSFLRKNGPLIQTKKPFIPKVEITRWSENHNKFILKWPYSQSDTYWYIYDVTRPEENSKTLNFAEEDARLNFTHLSPANPEATKIWALENGNLRLINTDNNSISEILAQNVEKFSNVGSTVGFISIGADGNRTISIYKEGEEGSTVLETIGKDIKTVNLALGRSWINDWIAYSLDARIFVRAGELPSFGKKPNLRTVAENDLEFTPTNLAASPTSRFLIAKNADKTTALDTELQTSFTYDFPGETINWLDNYLLWTEDQGNLTVIDWNGQNRRELTPIAPGKNLALTENNHWLYYITADETEGFILNRERL